MKIPTVLMAAFAVGSLLTVSVSAEEAAARVGQKEASRTPEALLSLPVPYRADDLRALAEMPTRSKSENTRMMRLILMAAAKRDASFQYLLKDPKLPKSRNVELALAGYDYMLNQSNESLDKILAQLATEGMGADVDTIVVLGVVDEWDRTVRAFKKHFYHTDGAGGSCMRYFLEMRAALYPEEYQKMHPQFKHSRLKKTYRAYLAKAAEEGGSE